MGDTKEEGGCNAKLLNCVELVLSRHLAVLDAVTRIGSGVRHLGLAVSMDNVVDRRVAIRVDSDLVAHRVQLRHPRSQLLAALARVSAVGRIVARRHVIGLREVASVALVGPVVHELDGAELQPLATEAGEEASGLAGRFHTRA